MFQQSLEGLDIECLLMVGKMLEAWGYQGEG